MSAGNPATTILPRFVSRHFAARADTPSTTRKIGEEMGVEILFYPNSNNYATGYSLKKQLPKKLNAYTEKRLRELIRLVFSQSDIFR